MPSTKLDDFERRVLATHDGTNDPYERAKELHKDYEAALDRWHDWAGERSSKILLWKLLHDTVTDSGLQQDLKSSGGMPSVSSLRDELGVELKGKPTIPDRLEEHTTVASYLALNKGYDGDSHFVEFGREIRERRLLVEITARQLVSYLRFGAIRGVDNDEDPAWSFDENMAAGAGNLIPAINDGTYVEIVDRWKTLLDRLHESKDGQRHLATLWRHDATGMPYVPNVLVPTEDQWNAGASQYFENDSYPEDDSTLTLKKEDSHLFQSVRRLANHAQPGLLYLYLTGGDLATVSKGIGGLLSPFISKQDITDATRDLPSNEPLVSSPSQVSSGDPDDIAGLLNTILSAGKDVAEAGSDEDETTSTLTNGLPFIMTGVSFVSGVIYNDEEENVSAPVKNELRWATSTAGSAVGWMDYGGSINDLLESVDVEEIAALAKVGDAAALAGPIISMIDITWTIYDAMQAGQRRDASVAVGQALGAVGAGMATADTIYGLAVEGGGSLFASIGEGSVGGPVGMAVAGALSIGGFALTHFTADSELETFVKNCRFGSAWGWQAPHMYNDGYHTPGEMKYLWNDPEADPGAEATGKSYEHKNWVNYSRQVSSFFTILHPFSATVGYTSKAQGKDGIVELSSVNVGPSALMTCRPIIWRGNYHELRKDWHLETTLLRWGEKQGEPGSRWPAKGADHESPLNSHEEPPQSLPLDAKRTRTFQSVVMKPTPETPRGSNEYELPDHLTYWKGKRGISMDGNPEMAFDEVFGISDDDLETINSKLSTNHWMEVAITTRSLSAQLREFGEDVGIGEDYSPGDLPVAIRVQTAVDVNALPRFNFI